MADLNQASFDALTARVDALEAEVFPPVDCVLSEWALESAGAWGACQPDGTQTRAETWGRAIVTAPAYGGAPCGPLTEERIGTQGCVYVPPAHAYFNTLVARPDHWKSYSLRDPAQLAAPKNGGYANANSVPLAVTYSPSTDYDPNRQDAAKIVIPAFNPPFGTLAAPVASSASGAMDTIQLSKGGLDNNRAIKIDDEIMTVVRVSGSAPSTTVTVIRGQHGTAAAAHSVGASAAASGNSLANQIRLPLGTSDGNTYLFTWDVYFTSSYLNSGLTNYKAFQLSTGNGSRWWELNTYFSGNRAPCFTPGRDIMGIEARSYNSVGGPAQWDPLMASKAGPNVLDNQPLGPKVNAFCVKPNTWTRFWVQVVQVANDYDRTSLWVADETQDAVLIYDGLQLSVPVVNGVSSITKFWVEMNTSTDKFTRGDLRDFVSYVRNVVALRNAGDPTPLLTRPLRS